MEAYQRFTGTIRLRPDYSGRGLKPHAGALEGLECEFRVLWLMDGDDPYPGEYALGPVGEDAVRQFDACQITWIASGDVTPHPTASNPGGG